MEFKGKLWIPFMLMSLFWLGNLSAVNGLKCPFCISIENDDDPCDDPPKMRCDPDFRRGNINLNQIIRNSDVSSNGFDSSQPRRTYGVESRSDDDSEGSISFVCAKFRGRFGVFGSDLWSEELIFRGCMPKHPEYNSEGTYDITERTPFFIAMGTNVDFEGELTIGAAGVGASVLTMSVIMAIGVVIMQIIRY